MFDEILTKEFYQNTILTWLLAFVVISVGIFLAKFSYWVSSRILKRLAKKTKSKFDDLIIDMIEEPIVMAIVISILWFSLHHILSFKGTVSFWINKIYYILIIINIAWVITRVVNALLDKYIKPLTEKTETDIDDVLLPLFKSSFSFIIWSLAVILGLDNAGYDVGAILAGLGLGGVAIALAAKDTIANIFGGIVVLTNRPFRVGERIQFEDDWADVIEIGLRTTRLRHPDFGYIISVPNSHFLTKAVVNLPKKAGYLYFMDLKLSVKTTPVKMQLAFDILAKIVAENSKVNLKDVRLIDFNNNALGLRVYIDVKEFGLRHLVRSEIRLEIHRLFYENNIHFAELPYSIIEETDITPVKTSFYNIGDMVKSYKSKQNSSQ